MTVRFSCGWVVHFFWHDPKETEPKKKSRLNIFVGFTLSSAKVSKLATLKQLKLLHALSVASLFAKNIMPNWVLLGWTPCGIGDIVNLPCGLGDAPRDVSTWGNIIETPFKR